MKINLEVNNTIKSPIEDIFFVHVAEKTFANLEDDFFGDREINISLALVAKDEIQKFNNEYRKYDSVTDVLSFAEYESEDELKSAIKNNQEVFLGELILCYDDIMEYAEKEQLNFEKELAKVVSHGILHIIGFSHGEKMFALQEKVSDIFLS